MNITDVKRLQGTPPGVVGACSGPSGAPPVAPVAPWLSVVLVRCFSVQDAGSYTWPERVLLLDSVTTVVPIGNSRSMSSRGGVVSVFRERFSCICDSWGLYRFYRVWKILSCGVLGLLEVSVSAILCHSSL